MNLNYAKLFNHSIIGYIFCLFLSFLGMAQASSLNINVTNSLIDIEANQSPLINVLQAISLKTGMILKTEDSLTDSITLHLYEASIEDCLRRLLANRNYVLLFRKTENNRFVPIEVRILGNNTLKTINEKNNFISKSNSDIGRDPLNAEDYKKKYRKKWFEQKIQNKNILTKQISAIPADKGTKLPEDQSGKGILIKNISIDSIFHQIGINEGDIISDVNGTSVNTTDDFIDALQSSPGKLPSIRIERLKNNHEIDPIYIELH
ncbi:MAG: PDZ domain-containing protein [Desulfobacterales bacterium]|nr:PDZ domain-containing protein [Desulfobacterales bacterium]